MICMNKLGSIRVVDESDCYAGDITEVTRSSEEDWKDLS